MVVRAMEVAVLCGFSGLVFQMKDMAVGYTSAALKLSILRFPSTCCGYQVCESNGPHGLQ